MSFQWTFVAAFLYCELAIVLFLLLPFVGRYLSKILKTRLVKRLSSSANFYFQFIVGIFFLLFLDSIRELRKYSHAKPNDASTPFAETQINMKLFRAQRNFYIAGVALFLWFVIRRLTNLLSYQMQTQSEKAPQTTQPLTASTEPSAPVDISQYEIQIQDLQAHLKDSEKAKEDLEERCNTYRQDYQRLIQEHDKLKAQFEKINPSKESEKDE